mmetsp:Transcript_4381/g.8968  ORF Transcript_4381/g.8968 Transcript_4381/m.8968 type:complete len:241 (+) Transcript_4381:582-1304(+)
MIPLWQDGLCFLPLASKLHIHRHAPFHSSKALVGNLPRGFSWNSPAAELWVWHVPNEVHLIHVLQKLAFHLVRRQAGFHALTLWKPRERHVVREEHWGGAERALAVHRAEGGQVLRDFRGGGVYVHPRLIQRRPEVHVAAPVPEADRLAGGGDGAAHQVVALAVNLMGLSAHSRIVDVCDEHRAVAGHDQEGARKLRLEAQHGASRVERNVRQRTRPCPDVVHLNHRVVSHSPMPLHQTR